MGTVQRYQRRYLWSLQDWHPRTWRWHPRTLHILLFLSRTADGCLGGIISGTAFVGRIIVATLVGLPLEILVDCSAVSTSNDFKSTSNRPMCCASDSNLSGSVFISGLTTLSSCFDGCSIFAIFSGLTTSSSWLLPATASALLPGSLPTIIGHCLLHIQYLPLSLLARVCPRHLCFHLSQSYSYFSHLPAPSDVPYHKYRPFMRRAAGGCIAPRVPVALLRFFS